METQTIINGKEYKYYDKFTKWIKNLKEGFIVQKDYKGYPTLPSNSDYGLEIYDNADSEERRFIFHTLITQFEEALRHWKVDKDYLWTDEGRKEHKEFLEKIEFMLPYMKKDWDKFW